MTTQLDLSTLARSTDEEILALVTAVAKLKTGGVLDKQILMTMAMFRGSLASMYFPVEDVQEMVKYLEQQIEDTANVLNKLRFELLEQTEDAAQDSEIKSEEAVSNVRKLH